MSRFSRANRDRRDPPSSQESKPAPVHVVRDSTKGAAAVLAILALLFHAIYWNRFLGPSSSGMFFHAAELMLEGKTPYRDFFLIVPILHPLKIAALMELFGHKLIVLRAEAVLERIALAVLVFYWLRRFTPMLPSFLGALLGIVMFASDSTDPLASYHQDSALWACCAGFAATLTLESASRSRIAWAAAAGFAASLCFWTKQTTGVGVLAAIPVLWAWLEWRRGPGRIGPLWVAFAAGLIPVSGAVMGWLAGRGALGQFWLQVFGNSSAKGSGAELFLRPVLQMWALAMVAAIAVAIITLAARNGKPAWDRPYVRPLAASAIIAAAMFLAIPLFATGPTTTFSYILAGILFHAGLYGCGVIGIAAAFDGEHPALLLMSGAGFASAYMLSLSWAAYAPMAMPSIAVCTAVAMARIGGRSARLEAIAGALVLLVIALLVVKKAREPFYWMGWMETAVAGADVKSAAPMLEGIRMTPDTRDVFDGVTGLVRRNAQPGDTLLVYPYYPIFYSSTGLRAPTFTFNHFVDVTPDWIVERDLAAMRAAPPAFIVFLEEDKDDVEVNDRVFRGGRPSQSRKLAALIRDMTQHYRLLGAFRTPGKQCDLRVWRRP